MRPRSQFIQKAHSDLQELLGARSGTIFQMLRYGFVGCLSNLAGYLIYIGVTWLGVEPKVAVGVLYPVAVFISYFGHARYTFSSNQKNASGELFRYLAAHVVGYATNLALLYFLHDLMGFPHEWVQLLAIVLVAGLLFLLFKYYVFPNKGRREQTT